MVSIDATSYMEVSQNLLLDP